jgi:hypothetical protein
MIVYSSEPCIGPHCFPLENNTGWTWTLVSRLSELLEEAEARYGPRDREWTLIGIEFGGDTPGTWFPGNRRHVVIRLSDNARTNPARALFQLAHEAIHLLSPWSGAPAMEEGVATLFSDEVSLRFAADGWFFSSEPDYVHCRDVTRTLLALHPDGVRTLRAKEPHFHLMTPTLITSTFPDVPEQLAGALCEPFSSVRARLHPS